MTPVDGLLSTLSLFFDAKDLSNDKQNGTYNNQKDLQYNCN
jgi:hypothetical protein